VPKRRRRRNEGSVFFDKNGRTWIARISLGVRNGRRVGKKASAPTEELAKLELVRLRKAYGRGALDGAMMTLDAYLGEWLDGVRPSVRPATFVSYSGHVRMHISPLLGGIVVGRLRPQDIRRLIADRLSVGLSPTTVRRIITTLHMALNRGIADGSLETNPANGLSLPRAQRHVITAMSWDDADAIVAAVRGDQFEALYVLLLYAGLRLGEAVALDWRDVDLDRGTILVRQGKTAAARRTVPLADFAWDALRRHESFATGGKLSPVFRAPRNGQRLRGDVVTHAFPRLLERAGLPRMRVHDLRHGTATLLVAQGVPMRDIADLLGHATPSVTANTYAHVTFAQQRKAIQTLNRRQGDANVSSIDVLRVAKQGT